MQRVEDVRSKLIIILLTRDKVKYLTSLMDVRVNIPEEIEKQLGKMELLLKIH